MNRQAILTCLGATFGGSFLFMGMTGFVLLTAHYNADTMPDTPWFPLPVLAGVFAVTWWCDRRWNIGLRTPLQAPLSLVVAFAVLSMIAANGVMVLSMVAHDVVYVPTLGPAETSLTFQLTYWVAISIAMSTLSEMCFRGLMQSLLSRHMAIWLAVFIVVMFNTFSHPWDTLWPRFFSAMAFLLAWSCLIVLCGSLKAAIVTHLIAVMCRDLPYWWIDEVPMGEVSTGFTGSVVAICAAATLAAWWVAMRIRRRQRQTHT
ncbi:MAG: CPBP family intramembrane metalloprotease [Gammaproteobacteria bacterium]|nr:CPBP family intramembrane metalloprotease [Gammaproteobacteria bacterium]